jgi:dTDP-4-dehydrorhamnose reductase
MIHISTDYVFSGDNPPYGEDDRPAPVNYYGETKRVAEQRVAAVHPGAVLLRIPALYGNPPAPILSAMVAEGIQAATATARTPQDDVIVRYPTFTGDVAEVIRFLLATPVSGIVHASAGKPATRYAWALAIARLLGRPDAPIERAAHDPNRIARRPLNSQLSIARLRALGGPPLRDFTDVLPGLLPEQLSRTS